MLHFKYIQRKLLITSLICAALCLVGSVETFAQEVQSPSTTSYSHGITLFKSGLYEQAARELEQFIARNPQNSLVLSAHFYHARALAEAQPGNARQYYRQFITRYPQTAFTQKFWLI